jgi:hypothetical protein
MADAVRMFVPISQAAGLYPDLAPLLPAINQALRHINFGQMDHLPYYDAIAGYRLHMRAELLPQGTGRPPHIGHWQLEVSRDGAPHVLYLQGKANSGEELCEVVFPCGPSAASEGLQS